MRVSASKIQTWMSCPLQARFKYVDRLPTRSSSSSVFGNCMHTALEHYNHHGDVDRAVEMFKEIWDDPSKIGREIDVWTRRTSAGGFREKGIKLLVAFDERVKREGRTMIATEHPFLVPIGDHEIVGYVDCLEVRLSGRGKDTLRIVDYKTGAKEPWSDALRNNVQFTCYDYASRQPEFWLGWPGDPEFPGMPDGGKLWDKYKNFPRRGVYWHLSGDKEKDVGERTEEDHKRLYRVIDEMDKAMRHEVYVPCLSGDTCTFCDFTEQCGITIPSSEDRMSDLEWF